jgi:hypothetical protein
MQPVHAGMIKYPPVAELSSSIAAPDISASLSIPVSPMVLTANLIGAGASVSPPMREITLGVQYPSILAAGRPDTVELSLSADIPACIWNVNDSDLSSLQIIYKCYLTGDAETPVLDDLELPMSSFQSTLRDGGPSYISCVIPAATAYVDNIIARSHGDIVIKYGYRFQDGREQLTEIARVDYEDIRVDTGAKSSSATISGHATTTAAGGSVRAASGVSYYALQANGLRRIRASVDMWLRCGDIVTFPLGGEEQQFTVGEISYTVSTRAAAMEAAEV